MHKACRGGARDSREKHLAEDDLWKLRVGLGLEVLREVVEVAKLCLLEQERGGSHDGEEWKSVAVDAPAYMVGVAPIVDQVVCTSERR
jgi:hypothetical protein